MAGWTPDEYLELCRYILFCQKENRAPSAQEAQAALLAKKIFLSISINAFVVPVRHFEACIDSLSKLRQSSQFQFSSPEVLRGREMEANGGEQNFNSPRLLDDHLASPGSPNLSCSKDVADSIQKFMDERVGRVKDLESEIMKWKERLASTEQQIQALMQRKEQERKHLEEAEGKQQVELDNIANRIRRTP